MLLDISKAVSLLLCILSLGALLTSAFFVPGSHWDERLLESLMRILLAGCICFASGLLFEWSEPSRPPLQSSLKDEPDFGILRTLPVQLFLWALAGMSVLFALSWYLEQYYIPLIWRNQPH